MSEQSRANQLSVWGIILAVIAIVVTIYLATPKGKVSVGDKPDIIVCLHSITSQPTPSSSSGTSPQLGPNNGFDVSVSFYLLNRGSAEATTTRVNFNISGQAGNGDAIQDSFYVSVMQSVPANGVSSLLRPYPHTGAISEQIEQGSFQEVSSQVTWANGQGSSWENIHNSSWENDPNCPL